MRADGEFVEEKATSQEFLAALCSFTIVSERVDQVELISITLLLEREGIHSLTSS